MMIGTMTFKSGGREVFYNRLSFGLAVFIPLVLIIAWHLINQKYPFSDSGFYFSRAQVLYNLCRSDGFFHGAAALYKTSSFSPLLLPHFSVPFLALSQGKVLFSAGATMIFFFLLFLVYSYKLSRLYLDRWAACVGTIILGTICRFFDSACIYMPEMPLMALAVFAAYYLVKSNFFASRKYALFAGAAVGLCLCIRTVQFLLAASIPLAIFLVYLLRNRRISRGDLILAVLFVFFCVFCLVLSLRRLIPGLFLLVLFLLAVFVFLGGLIYLRRKAASRGKAVGNLNFLLFIVSAFFILTVYLLPRMQDFYYLVSQSSFGTMNRLYPGPSGPRNFLGHVSGTFSWMGILPVFFLTAAGLTALAGNFREFLRHKKVLMPLCFGILAMVPYLAIVSFSPGGEFRRLIIGVEFFLFGLAVIALYPQFAFPKSRFLLMSLLALLQVAGLSLAVFGPKDFQPGGLSNVLFEVRKPFRGVDASRQAFQELLVRRNILGNRDKISFAALFLEPGVFDAFALNVMAGERDDLIWAWDFYYPWEFDNLKDGYQQLAAQYKFVLINVPAGTNSENLLPHQRLGLDIINKYHDSTLPSVGLEFIDKFQVEGRQLLLLKTGLQNQ